MKSLLIVPFILINLLGSFSDNNPIRNIENRPTNLYNRVLIKKVTLQKFPYRKSDGEKWDNMAGMYLPDIFLCFKGNNTSFICDDEKRLENVERGETVPFATNFTLSNLQSSYSIDFIDYDSFTENDIVGHFMFNPNKFTGLTSVMLVDGDAEMKLELEWLSSN